MRNKLKGWLAKWLPDIIWDLYRLIQYKRKRRLDETKALENRFDIIFERNLWNSIESVSGTGSTIEQARKLIEQIPAIVASYEIGTILDVPCGDFNWMKLVSLDGVKYTGGDIVEAVIVRNQEKFGGPLRSFKKLDIVNDPLPSCDLLLCRDCLVHFSYDMIDKAIRNIKQSDCKYLLTTSFINRRLNFDIITGDWRPINLQIRPFNFPKPLQIVLEECTEGNGTAYDKSLLLYRVEDIPLMSS